jgi:penicillin-binding protein 1A
VGTRRIARIARQMGIRTPLSTNPAITLGGLQQGVTPLDMAHAFETLAAGGNRVTGTMGAAEDGPVGVRSVEDPSRHRTIRNRTILIKAVSRKLAAMETEILRGVITSGTGRDAATGGFAAGKTGTTENYGDAWFVGFNKRWTVAVWVGYPDTLRPMKTEYGGQPVAGGTYPASIWRDFINQANGIVNQRLAERAAREGRTYTPPDETTDGGSGYDSGGSSGGEGSGAGTTTGESGSGSSGGGSGTGDGDSGSSGGGGGGESGGGGGGESGGGGAGGGGESGGGGGGGGGGSSGGTSGGTGAG